MTLPSFGSRLRAARAAKGLTQQELSQRAEIALRSVAAYEGDEAQPISEGLRRLAVALDVSADALLGIIIERELFPGSVTISASAGDDLGCDLGHALEMSRTSNAALDAQLVALKDGHIDAAEGERIELACDESIRATARVREVARRARVERSIPARTPLRAVKAAS